jgi:hypothetical protein
MKFDKEDIQKLVLGGIILIGLLYGYFSILLGPLQKQREARQKAIAALDPKIAAAQSQIQRTAALEARAPEAQETISKIDSMIPEGSPVAWFPSRMGEFFKTHGFDKSTTRLNNELQDKELPGYRRITWSIDVPRLEFVPFAATLAVLENEEPLVEVSSVQFEINRDEVGLQRALITVNNIVKQ